MNTEGTKDTLRPIHVIAKEIKEKWKKPYFGAVPYLDAMREMTTAKSSYGLDPGHEILNYFLSNATTWRGEDARRIKAELKEHLKGVQG